MLCASFPLAFQESTCMSFQQEYFMYSPSPINHHAMWGRHRQNHQEKTLWCKSSIKSNCHTESPQQGSTTLKSSTQLTSAIQSGKNISFLFFFMFLSRRNNTVIKAIKIQSAQRFRQFGKRYTRMLKLARHAVLKPQNISAGLL